MYLFGSLGVRKRGKYIVLEKKRFYLVVHSVNTSNEQDWVRKSHEPETPTGFPMRVIGIQVLWSPSVAFSSTLLRGWIGNRGAGLKLTLCYGMTASQEMQEPLCCSAYCYHTLFNGIRLYGPFVWIYHSLLNYVLIRLKISNF